MCITISVTYILNNKIGCQISSCCAIKLYLFTIHKYQINEKYFFNYIISLILYICFYYTLIYEQIRIKYNIYNFFL